MFILKLNDRNGLELNENDFVKISNGKSFDFFSQVKYIEETKSIIPFSVFTFHSIVKIDSIPLNAVKSKLADYDVWYLYNDDAEADNDSFLYDNYLRSWRECELKLEDRCFKIELINKPQLTLF
jgi:hypothetical protein